MCWKIGFLPSRRNERFINRSRLQPSRRVVISGRILTKLLSWIWTVGLSLLVDLVNGVVYRELNIPRGGHIRQRLGMFDD